MEESNHKDTPKKIVEPLITVPKPRPQIHHQQKQNNVSINASLNASSNNCAVKLGPGMSKYAELLHVIEELGQHIRPSYAGHRGSAEKMRQGIVKARLLVKECLNETDRNGRQ